MTRDDIIRMAREAGRSDWAQEKYGVTLDQVFERFAVLVAAAAKAEEREACAKVCGELADNPENSEQYRMGANWARERIRARSNP